MILEFPPGSLLPPDEPEDDTVTTLLAEIDALHLAIREALAALGRDDLAGAILTLKNALDAT